MNRRGFLAASGALLSGGCVAPTALTGNSGNHLDSPSCPLSIAAEDGPTCAANEAGTVKMVATKQTANEQTSPVLNGPRDTIQFSLVNDSDRSLEWRVPSWRFWRHHDGEWQALGHGRLGAVKRFTTAPGSSYSWIVERDLTTVVPEALRDEMADVDTRSDDEQWREFTYALLPGVYAFGHSGRLEGTEEFRLFVRRFRVTGWDLGLGSATDVSVRDQSDGTRIVRVTADALEGDRVSLVLDRRNDTEPSSFAYYPGELIGSLSESADEFDRGRTTVTTRFLLWHALANWPESADRVRVECRASEVPGRGLPYPSYLLRDGSHWRLRGERGWVDS